MFSSFLQDGTTSLTSTAVINLTLAFVVFVLGAYIFYKDKRNVVHQSFLLICLSAGFWTFTATMADVVRLPEQTLLWARLAVVGPMFFLAFFLRFTYQFPTNRVKRPRLSLLVILAPVLLALPLVLSDANISSVTLRDWGTDFEPGPLYAYVFVLLCAYLPLGTRNLIRSYRETEEVLVRRQVLTIWFGMGLLTISALITNLVLPVVFEYARASVVGPASTAIFVLLTSYAIVKHGLMNVKVIATESFVLLFVFISGARMFLSGSVSETVLMLTMFILTIVFGVLLIKSVRTEVKRREELLVLSSELALKNEKLKEMDKLKSDFISIASHQLRTPISVIKGYLTLILDGAYGKVEGPMQEKVSSMIDMAERLVTMINEMLNVSRIERNKIDYVCSAFDVVEVAGSVTAEMQERAAEKKLALSFVAHDAAGTAVAQADRDKTKEVLSNLIDNAIKYSVKGTVQVVVKARPALRDVMVTISDEGYGIAPEDAAHMFEKFYRSNMPEIARLTGTGLGLYVCRMFLRDMGGDVWIERTALGKGTVFAFSVPMDKAGRCDMKSEIHPQAR